MKSQQNGSKLWVWSGKLVVPEVAGSEFTPPVPVPQTSESPTVTWTIDLVIGPMTVRLDAATPVAQVFALLIATCKLNGVDPTHV